MRKVSPLLILLLILTALPILAAPVTKQTVLPNGMKVIVREDHTAPVVSLMVWVGVGSRNEVEGNRGISHFIEHLLFKGTNKRAVGEVSREIGALGGRVNAATSYDFTQFFVEIGSRYFDNALDIFSDVTQNSAFDPAEVEKERSVVQEEIRMYRDDPGHRLWGAFTQEFFKKSPYRYMIAATTEEVQKITREQIMDYFHRYYIPNNMVVAVVGDVNADEAMAKVAAAFESFPKGSMPNDVIAKEPAQKGIRRATDTMEIKQAYLALGFHAPSMESKDSYALDVLAQILGNGRASRLYQSLREEKQEVYEVDMGYETLKDAGLIIVSAVADPKNLTQVEKDLLAQLDAIQELGVAPQEVTRAKNKITSNWAFAHETYEQQSEEIGYYELLGMPDYPKTYVRKISQVNSDDVKAVARKYLDLDRYTLGIVGPTPAAKDEKTEPKPQGAVPGKGSDTPAAAENAPTLTTLPNGLRVVTQESHSADVVSVQLLINVGSRDETDANNGITTLMQEVVAKGSGTRTATQIAELLENAGVRYSTSGGEDFSSISIDATARGVETGVLALAEFAQNATFPEAEVDKEKKQILNAIEQQENEPSSYAAKLFQESFYQKHPYRLNALGTTESVKKITQPEIRKWYHDYYRPENMVLVVVGNFNTPALMKTVSELFSWMPKRTMVPMQEDIKEPVREKPNVVVREMEAEQARILIGFPAPPVGDPDYAAIKILNTALGSGMSSILFDKIREQQGLVYDVSSGFPGKQGPSYLIVSAGTKPQTIDATRDGILATLRDVAEKGLTEKQFTDAKRYYLGNFDLNHQTAEDRAGFLGNYEIRGLGYKFDKEFPKMIDRVTLEDVNRVAKKYLLTEGYTVVIVKPKGK